MWRLVFSPHSIKNNIQRKQLYWTNFAKAHYKSIACASYKFQASKSKIGNCLQSNAAGKRCDECQAGTFGLQEEQAEGCVPCFCFNRTTQCREAVATWTQVRTPRPRTLSVNYDNTTGTENAFPVNTQEVCYINVSSKSTLSLCIGHVFGYRWN